MRATTLLRRLVGIAELFVAEVLFTMGGVLTVVVRPKWRRPRCGVCGRRGRVYDRRPVRRWSHLSLGRCRIDLSYAPWRVDCPECGIRTERVPWAAHGSRFTRDFEELVAYLAQITDQTKVTQLTGVAWATVGTIVERVVQQRLDPSRLDRLRRIGIDEFSYRKRHHYVTVVVDHDRRRVVWAAEGRSAAVLGAFFEALGETRRRQLDLVTMDMSGGYLKAVGQWLPEATVVFDRFHVERLVLDALDGVRRSLVRELLGTAEARAVKGTRFTLLRNPWNITPAEEEKLAELQRRYRPLYRAYLLKESFVAALEQPDSDQARNALERWLSWAQRSRLKPFVRVARTVRRHLEGILAYVDRGFTNAVVEGINNKLRMVARRAFGFHSAEPLISMLYLVCGGIQLTPPLPTRT